MISIVDFGMGNISSVANAFVHWGEEICVISKPSEIEKAKKLVLPGVGSFREAMSALKRMDLIQALNEAVLVKKTPILGICLGMQIMAQEGEEDGGSEGLGWVEAKVVPLFGNQSQSSLTIPHMGFNFVKNIFEENDGDYYFCHSYKLTSLSSDFRFGYCQYGERFIASLHKDNIWGTQFHPEKSQSNGLLLLKKFIDVEASGV